MARFDAYRTAELVTRHLVAAGFSVGCDGSSLSSSQYVTAARYDEDDNEIFEQVKIRISDHALPPTYGQMNGWADYEIGPHMEACDDWTRIVLRLCGDAGLPVPAAVRALRTRRQKAEDTARAARDARNAEAAAWRATEAQRLAARQAALIAAGYGHLTGKARKRAIAKLGV